MSTLATPLGSTLRAPADRLVAGVRAAWRRSVLLRAAVWAPALLASAALLLVAADLLVPMRAAAREALRWIPVLAAAGTLAWALHRAVFPPSPRRLALLAEERIPALENRLLTAIDLPATARDGVVGRAFVADAERRLAGAGARGVAPARVRRPAAVLAVSLTAGALFALAFPAAAAEAWTRWMHPADAYATKWEEVRAETLPGRPPAPVPPFDELRWTVTPPAYTGLAAREGRGDDPVSALPGSRVRIRSRFSPRWSGVHAEAIGGAPLAVARRGDEWVVELVLPADARGVTLEARAEGEVVDRRVVPLVPLADQPPDVQLLAPEEDLVLAAGAGRVVFRAIATDDYGLGAFRLHWTHSRGSGESYEFVEGNWEFGRVERSGREARGELAVDLAALRLEPGDIMHVRAVARDRNDVTGPGESVSRTRIVRVARPEELDKVNTDIGAPPELPEDPVLSQRMVILMTERLQRERPRLRPDALAHRAAEIARHQARLRDVVGEQIYVRQTEALQAEGLEFGYVEQVGTGGGHDHAGEAGDEHGHDAPSPEEVLERASEATGGGGMEEFEHRHDEAPILAVNRDLMRLHNLMWASEQELGLSKPDSALPHQYEALRMIQAMNQAERVYPRGNVRVDPIDPAAARGEGKLDEAAPGGHRAGTALPSLVPLLAELDRVAAGVGRRPPRESSLAISDLAARLLGERGVDAGAAALVSRAAGEAGAGRTERARELLGRARGVLAPPAAAGARPLPSTADPAAAEYFRRIGGGR